MTDIKELSPADLNFWCARAKGIRAAHHKDYIDDSGRIWCDNRKEWVAIDWSFIGPIIGGDFSLLKEVHDIAEKLLNDSGGAPGWLDILSICKLVIIKSEYGETVDAN